MKFFDTKDLRDDEIYLDLKKTKQANPEKNYVPAYDFDICLLDSTIVGNCSLRVGHNRNIYYAGNIGYGVLEEYRGNKYSLKASKLLFKLAKKHDLEYLYITCKPDNLPSDTICRLLGGKLIETTDVPKDLEMYEEGVHRVNIYKYDI